MIQTEPFRIELALAVANFTAWTGDDDEPEILISTLPQMDLSCIEDVLEA